MEIVRSLGDHTPETNRSTRLAPQPRSEASDQNKISMSRDSRDTPARRFRTSDHQNRSNAFESVQATNTDSSIKSHRARNCSWRDLIRRRPPGTCRQRGKPTQQAPPTNDALLPARQKFFYLRQKFLNMFLHRESPQNRTLDHHAEIGGRLRRKIVLLATDYNAKIVTQIQNQAPRL